jgi:hypothetical protein
VCFAHTEAALACNCKTLLWCDLCLNFQWSERAVSSRQERMRATFGRWRHFTEESQK